MRYLRTIITGWCLLFYLQSACLPLDLILSALRLAPKKHVCRCKITGVHDRGCLCPCCAAERHAHAEKPSCWPEPRAC